MGALGRSTGRPSDVPSKRRPQSYSDAVLGPDESHAELVEPQNEADDTCLPKWTTRIPRRTVPRLRLVLDPRSVETLSRRPA